MRSAELMRSPWNQARMLVKKNMTQFMMPKAKQALSMAHALSMLADTLVLMSA